jgi:hypothetical protein
MDKDIVVTVKSGTTEPPWDRYVLFRGQQSSATHSALEHVASAHSDTVAVAHFEDPGSKSVSWITNDTTVDTLPGGETDESSRCLPLRKCSAPHLAPLRASKKPCGKLVAMTVLLRQGRISAPKYCHVEAPNPG